MKFKRVLCMGMAAVLTYANLLQITIQAQQIQEETGKDGEEIQGQEDVPWDLQNPELETEDIEEEILNQAVSEEGNWYGNFQYKALGDGTLEITRYKEDDVKEITIPAKIEEKKVTSIGGSAFSGCSSLSSISLPEGVTSIGSYTF